MKAFFRWQVQKWQAAFLGWEPQIAGHEIAAVAALAVTTFVFGLIVTIHQLCDTPQKQEKHMVFTTYFGADGRSGPGRATIAHNGYVRLLGTQNHTARRFKRYTGQPGMPTSQLSNGSYLTNTIYCGNQGQKATEFFTGKSLSGQAVFWPVLLRRMGVN